MAKSVEEEVNELIGNFGWEAALQAMIDLANQKVREADAFNLKKTGDALRAMRIKLVLAKVEATP